MPFVVLSDLVNFKRIHYTFVLIQKPVNLAMLDYSTLKEKQRLKRDGFSESLSLRVHRALSWLKRAELCEDDDGCFIFLWIAFNAAYANDTGDHRIDESKRHKEFLKRITELDSDNLLQDILWKKYSDAIRVLLNNQYVYQPFWNYHNKIEGYDNWEQTFAGAMKKSTSAIMSKDNATVLQIVFSRLYTLRNQMMHGGATWNSSVNRQQIKDAKNILESIVPTVIHIMMQNDTEFWAEACYPVIV